MTKEAFCAVFGDISEDYVEKARADRKAQRSGRMEWCAAVACLCLAAAGAFLLYARRPADFHSMMNQSPVDTTAIMTLLPVDGWTACYQQVDLPESRFCHLVFPGGHQQSELSDPKGSGRRPYPLAVYILCSGRRCDLHLRGRAFRYLWG